MKLFVRIIDFQSLRYFFLCRGKEVVGFVIINESMTIIDVTISYQCVLIATPFFSSSRVFIRCATLFKDENYGYKNMSSAAPPDTEQIDNCAICLSPPTNPARTDCEHTFCTRCLLTSYKHKHKICPICRAPLIDDASSEPESEDSDQENNRTSSDSENGGSDVNVARFTRALNAELAWNIDCICDLELRRRIQSRVSPARPQTGSRDAVRDMYDQSQKTLLWHEMACHIFCLLLVAMCALLFAGHAYCNDQQAA